MCDVLLAGLAGHQDVVTVEKGEVNAVEDPVHELLEGHPGNLESKGHVQELEKG